MNIRDERILAGKKAYYNAARGFNCISSHYSDSFDYIHDCIVEMLETGESYDTIQPKVRRRVYYKKDKEKLTGTFSYKNKSAAGWGWKAARFFVKVNQLLKENGYPQGRHAMNGGEKHFGRYAVDFFIPGHNVIVEYNEQFHYDTRQKISRDRNRRIYLETITNLPVIIIHDGVESPAECARQVVKAIDYSILKKRFEDGCL